jgi:ferredoxin
MRQNLIIYFSGTGNSLFLAKKLSERIADSAIVPITKIADSEKVCAERVIIFLPVYAGGIPSCAARKMKTLKFGDDCYIAAVLNCAGGYGSAPEILSDLLQNAGGNELKALWVVRMPGNYTPLYGAEPKKRIEKMLTESCERIKVIANYIRLKKKHEFKGLPAIASNIFKLVWKAFQINVGRMGRRFRANTDCIGCGTCMRVCPVNNISLDKNNRPEWSNKCEQCMACLQYCPVEAINCFWWTKGRKRYRNPFVTVKSIEN